MKKWDKPEYLDLDIYKTKTDEGAICDCEAVGVTYNNDKENMTKRHYCHNKGNDGIINGWGVGHGRSEGCAMVHIDPKDNKTVLECCCYKQNS